MGLRLGNSPTTIENRKPARYFTCRLTVKLRFIPISRKAAKYFYFPRGYSRKYRKTPFYFRKKVLIRLHYGAKVKIKIGEVDSEIKSTIGVRQGSCEGPILFLSIMQAAMETLEWPEMPAPKKRSKKSTGVSRNFGRPYIDRMLVTSAEK